MVITNNLEWPMLSYYVIYCEKFRKVIQRTDKVALTSYHYSINYWTFSIFNYLHFITISFSYCHTPFPLEGNNNEAILAGDFNIHLLKLNNKMVFSEYFDILTSKNVYPKITLPTRLSNYNATLIDNFLCRLTESNQSKMVEVKHFTIQLSIMVMKKSFRFN